MNKLRFFISLIIATVFLFFFATPSLAITKTSGNLEATFDEPIFSPSDIWYPGLSLTRDLIVKNKGSGTETVIIDSQSETETGNISQVFHFKAEEGGSMIYEDSLANFWTAGEVTLSDLSGDQSKTYKLTASMDLAAGNEYQGKEAIFDLLVGFLGKPTAVTFIGGPSAPAGPPVCTDTKPGIPTGFTAVAGPGVGEVILSWTLPSPPYTYFLIAYSDTSSWPPKWGNPDVGNVNTYTVSGLGSGTYWFWLRAGNGCMPGDFTGPISPGAIVGIPGAVVAPGFAPGVLGVEEEEGELGAGIATAEGEVAGAVAPVCFWWWVVLLLEVLVLSGFYFLLAKSKREKRFWWSVAPATAFLAWLGDRIAHQWYTPSRFCPWTWLGAVLVAIGTTGIYLWFKRK